MTMFESGRYLHIIDRSIVICKNSLIICSKIKSLNHVTARLFSNSKLTLPRGLYDDITVVELCGTTDQIEWLNC